MEMARPLGEDVELPEGMTSRFIEGVNGLCMHVLEAGFVDPSRPALLLLHGFPELAWSWRKVMPRLAAAGYRVVAPDQRGYGTPGAGHWVQQEQPEAVIDELLAFLRA
jgi:pimeloyl-ACP methyl ester carboxylesterase